jgi:cytoskeletal protein CcmA (bactofilin family)
MGIFGRDERNSQSRPTASTPPKGQREADQTPSAGSTVIARGNHIQGTITGSSDVEIEGELKGAVDGTGHLRIASQGVVEGNLAARTVVVAGTVRGDILAGETIQLETSASVEGNITAPRIRMADGATFEGEVHMKSPDRTANQPARKP